MKFRIIINILINTLKILNFLKKVSERNFEFQKQNLKTNFENEIQKQINKFFYKKVQI